MGIKEIIEKMDRTSKEMIVLREQYNKLEDELIKEIQNAKKQQN